MSIEGIGGRRNLKEEMKTFSEFVKVMQGKYVTKNKRKKRSIETSKRIMAEKELEKSNHPFFEPSRLLCI